MPNKTFILIALGLLSFNALSGAPICKPYPFLQGGFNLNNFQQCEASFKTCNLNGGLPDLKCVKAQMDKNTNCQQLQQLALMLDANPASLSAEKVGEYTIIGENFIADGQNNYYIASPNACLVKTDLDPRSLSPELQKQYDK